MGTKEKLERARWLYKKPFANVEIYGRGIHRILYCPQSDSVILCYSNKRFHAPDDLDLDLIFEKEISDE